MARTTNNRKTQVNFRMTEESQELLRLLAAFESEKAGFPISQAGLLEKMIRDRAANCDVAVAADASAG